MGSEGSTELARSRCSWPVWRRRAAVEARPSGRRRRVRLPRRSRRTSRRTSASATPAIDAATVAQTNAAGSKPSTRDHQDLGVSAWAGDGHAVPGPGVAARRRGAPRRHRPVVRDRLVTRTVRRPHRVAGRAARRATTPASSNVVHEFAHCVVARRERGLRQQPALAVGDGRAVRSGPDSWTRAGSAT